MNLCKPAHKRSRKVKSELIDFSSNDYLGLSNNPKLSQLKLEPYGSGASAMVSGYQSAHQELEEFAADALGFDKAILFSNGYMANLGVIRTLTQLGHSFDLDRESHVSMIDGLLLSKATFKRHPHLNIKPQHSCIYTESVFSMSGDCCDINSLKKNECLVVDDAHGFGVTHIQPNKNIDCLILPCGKSLGAYGALVLGSHTLIEAIEQHARSLIYTTALPALCARAIHCNFKTLLEEPWRQEQLLKNRHIFENLSGLKSNSAIYKYEVNSIPSGLSLVKKAEQIGLHLYLMTPPTVTKPMLRITLSSEHMQIDIEKLAECLHEH